MSDEALAGLRALALGRRPAGKVLQNCRLFQFGLELYGEEAIVEAFRRLPLNAVDRFESLCCEAHVALFDAESVLFADVFGDFIGRIWHVCSSAISSPLESILIAASEPAIAVPFDPDLCQVRGDVHIAPSDHPWLSADGCAHVTAIGRRLARGDPGDAAIPGIAPETQDAALRRRVFVHRAFDDDARGAALCIVHTLGAGTTRSVSLAHAAVRFSFEGSQLLDSRELHDIAGARIEAAQTWRPRI